MAYTSDQIMLLYFIWKRKKKKVVFKSQSFPILLNMDNTEYTRLHLIEFLRDEAFHHHNFGLLGGKY